jgi:hypothetical protein
LVEQCLLTFEVLNQIELRRSQLSLALIAKTVERLQSRCPIGLTNKDFQASTSAKAKIAIRLYRKHGPHERNRFDTFDCQRMDQSGKLIERRTIGRLCLIHGYLQDVSYLVGQKVRSYAGQCPPHLVNQLMIDRLAKKKRPVYAVSEKLPDHGLVLLRRRHFRASQKQVELGRHR